MGKTRPGCSTVTFQNITEKELRALYTPRSAHNETNSFTDHMKNIQRDSTFYLLQETENILYKIYRCFRKSGPPDYVSLYAQDGKYHAKNHASIIKKETSLITKTDLRKEIKCFLERNYDASRYFIALIHMKCVATRSTDGKPC